MRETSFLVLGIVLSLVVFTGCTGGSGQVGSATGESSERTAEGKITVFAAGTLQDAFKELAETFKEQNPGSDVRFNFGESTALLTQLQQGAPADTFASADAAKMETAVEEGLVEEPRVFAHTRPVIIVPEGNPAGIQQLQDLAKPDIKITLELAPIGE